MLRVSQPWQTMEPRLNELSLPSDTVPCDLKKRTVNALADSAGEIASAKRIHYYYGVPPTVNHFHSTPLKEKRSLCFT